MMRGHREDTRTVHSVIIVLHTCHLSGRSRQNKGNRKIIFQNWFVTFWFHYILFFFYSCMIAKILLLTNKQGLSIKFYSLKFNFLFSSTIFYQQSLQYFRRWKCNISEFIMTDRRRTNQPTNQPTDRPTNQQTKMRDQRKVTLASI